MDLLIKCGHAGEALGKAFPARGLRDRPLRRRSRLADGRKRPTRDVRRQRSCASPAAGALNKARHKSKYANCATTQRSSARGRRGDGRPPQSSVRSCAYAISRARDPLVDHADFSDLLRVAGVAGTSGAETAHKPGVFQAVGRAERVRRACARRPRPLHARRGHRPRNCGRVRGWFVCGSSGTPSCRHSTPGGP